MNNISPNYVSINYWFFDRSIAMPHHMLNTYMLNKKDNRFS